MATNLTDESNEPGRTFAFCAKNETTLKCRVFQPKSLLWRKFLGDFVINLLDVIGEFTNPAFETSITEMPEHTELGFYLRPSSVNNLKPIQSPRSYGFVIEVATKETDKEKVLTELIFASEAVSEAVDFLAKKMSFDYDISVSFDFASSRITIALTVKKTL